MRVLLIDDDAGAAEIATAIEGVGPDITVEVAPTAAAALDRLESEAVDCLVSVFEVPGMSCEEFLDATRRIAPELPVVLLTDAPNEAVIDAIEGHGVEELRSKRELRDHPQYLLPTLVRLRASADTHGESMGGGLTKLFDEHALPMLLIDPESGAIIAANDAAVAFYRYTRAELTSMTIQDINALDPSQVAEKRRQAAEEGVSHFVFPHTLKNGEIRTVEVNSTPVTYGNRKVLFSIIQDTTKRTEAETALRVARNRYQRLTEQNIVGIYTVQDRRFTYVNPKLAEMFGTTPAEMVGSSIFDYVAEEDHALVAHQIKQREEGEVQSSHYTFAGVHPEKPRLVIEVHGSRIETEEGVMIIGTMLDITKRDSYERDLRRFSRALEYAAPAIYITDADGVIQYVNPKFESITGYEKSEAVGSTPAILNSGRMGEEYYRRLYATLDAGKVWEEAITNRRKSGELYEAYQTIAPYESEDGGIEGYVAIQSDITETRIQQQILQVFQRIFRHNLRNKLSIILGNAELLTPDLDEMVFKKYRQDIEEAATALVELSEKAAIVDTAIQVPDDIPEIDLVGVLERERRTVSEQYANVRIDVDAPEELVVEGGGSIEVAINEVLTNAIVHCDHDSPEISMRLSADVDEGMARLEISDNGPGLENVELTTLEVGEETPLVHTSGIGLWLIEWVIASLGGEAAFANDDPRGLTVIIELPLADGGETVR